MTGVQGAAEPPWLVVVAYTDLASDARVLRETREEMARGARVTVVVPRSPEQRLPDWMKGADVVWLRTSQQRGATTLAGQLRFMLAVARWRRKQARRPDVVHVHNMPDYLYWSVRAWQRDGARVVLDVHDIMSELAVHRFSGPARTGAVALLRLAERAVWKRVDHVVTVHDIYRDLIVSAGVPAERVSAVLNAPDPVLFNSSRRRVPSPGRFKIVFHGSVTERSGIANLVAAMPEITRAVAGAELLILGTGSARARVRAAVDALPNGIHVTFEDRYLPLEAVLERIADADLGVVPNEKSSFTAQLLPVKLLEYAALGIPAVSTRLPLVQRYLGASCAHLVDDPSPGALAEAVVLLAGDAAYRDRLATNALAFARSAGWPRYAAVLAHAVGLS